ncbi:two component transcriptional regulator, LuxR family [Emticicia oligotrophica DSM 17448]|uniref:Two component transcriptional regulator, LuxR family n=1 Tax=Emticicia oligotrophica (strain DSM 17448 / CIP 109782 / MTCC 6937 / GPTSA100-15) TaxID=929562 RepID=A0ABM5MYB1_EMTOG|nr:response regulator transcription factor [Emticicia oligotrophica]AFK02138.1 two component transcriptional regulator, LuxR family [Emticicia oligotrophica DSM 17448]
MIKISIYEDNTRLSQLLSLMIENTEGFELMGCHENCMEALHFTRLEMPDVIVMDIDMPQRSGIEGVFEIKSHFPNIKIIMHTVFDGNEHLFECLSKGADGYILKKDSSTRLISAIKEVFEGGAPMSPFIATKVLQSFRKQPIQEDFNLSQREIEVLSLLSKGFSYRMISIELNISVETVRRHIKNSYQKLHVQCGPEAVAKAIRNGLILP